MKKTVLFGIGKIAEEVYFYFKNDSEFDVAAFTVDQAFITEKEKFGLPVCAFETIENHYPPDQFNMFVALGYQELNQLRRRKYEQAKAKGYTLVSYINSKASNFGKVEIGDNCLVLENTVLQPLTKIGHNVFLWSSNHIGHHAEIKDHCYLAGHVVICGSTVVEEHCFLGVNATIGHNITIGANNLIGARTLITKSTAPNSVYIEKDTEKYRLSSEHFVRFSSL